MAKQKITFYCTDCGNETLKWQGRCPACGAWNTIVEAPSEKKSAPQSVAHKNRTSFGSGGSSKLQEIDISDSEIRFTTHMPELDRVLGGGAVKGSLVLIGGEPGIGKSTMLLQFCGLSDGAKILYVTGEESERQLKLRAERLFDSLDGFDELYVLAETNLSDVLAEINALEPEIVIVDSIQTMYNDAIDSAPGSVTQVKDVTMTLMRLAKSGGATVFIVGHVNKEGSIAGPKVLEHMVDCVLYFEGERTAGYRLLRAAKNRFGSTNEIGVFEMTGSGLIDVPNPSEMLLSGRPKNAPGTCVTCLMEGSRPILAELQALVSPTNSSNPRRNTNGIDYNRAALLMAVLEKRGAVRLSGQDVFINVIGGLTADEPAAELAAILAMASSYYDVPIGDELIALGEVGLTGELRAVTNLEQRLNEAKRLGFTAAVVPKRGLGKTPPPKDLQIIQAANIREALEAVIGKRK
ncbi:MAG: DNA repair protein RadA [Oscillospiraceae bacterium]|nr:DNA repair protein RadA [Oscillospiraceae bacterium]